MIITFTMFLLKQSSFSAVILLIVPLVLSILCVYYIRVYYICLQQKSDESALCVEQNDVEKEIKYAE